MTTHDVLKQIVEAGCDLTIASRIDHQLLLELIDLSKQSQSQLTISTQMATAELSKIAAMKLANVSFLHDPTGS